MSADSADLLPFLGLNYFDERHESLFFGRDEQLRDVLAKLETTRFVTVIGSSGTGKSSLVRAAVIPALRSGFLTAVGPVWRTVTFTPGSSPVGNLAKALETTLGATGIDVTLRRGRLGLVEAVRQSGQGKGENLLVLVDQFEEIFRYQRVAVDRNAAADEASAFVQLLLGGTAETDPSVFVIITMRSDYLGACAQFRDLPERINEGLYLIPRMRRDQMEDAIVGPAAVAGGTFDPALVQRLLNDAGEDPDQLPVLQHALLRTWLNWKRDASHPSHIELRHYEKTGGVRDGLDNHADEIYKPLDDRDKQIAMVLFKALTERDPSNLDIRRPTRVGRIMAIAGSSLSDVTRVADAFREEGVAFLKPAAPVKLKEDVRLDITHESLIRKWYRLGGAVAATTTGTKNWVQEEAEVRDQYRDLLRRARKASEGEVLIGADLDGALEWRQRRLPPEWALQYDKDENAYGLVARFIERSEAARANRRRRQRYYVTGTAVTFAIILVMGIAALQSRREARHEGDLRREAEGFRDLATAQRLATEADGLKDRDSRPELSALLAIEALRRKPIVEASQALRWPMTLLRKPVWSHEGPPRKPEDAADDFADSFAVESALRFSSSAQYVGQLNADSTLHVFRAVDGKEIPLPKFPGTPMTIAWADDELRVGAVVARQENEDTVDVNVLAIAPGGTEARQLAHAPCPTVCEATLSSDGARLFVPSDLASYGVPGGQRQSIVKDVEMLGPDGRLTLRPLGPSTKVARRRQIGQEEKTRYAVQLDGKPIGEIDDAGNRRLFDSGGKSDYMAWSGSSGQIRIYAKTPELTLAGHIQPRVTPTTFALSPDGQSIALGTENGEVRVMTWGTQRTRVGWSHAGPVVAIAFSADGRSIASIDDSGAIRVVPAGQPASAATRDWVPLQVRSGSLGIGAFDASGRFVLFVRPPNPAQLLDARSGAPVTFPGPGLIALSPDGRYAAWGGQGRLEVRDLTSGEQVRVTASVPRGRLLSLTLAAGAKYVAMRVSGGSISGEERPPASRSVTAVIDMQQGTTVPLRDELSSAASQSFSPDGRWLTLFRRNGNVSTILLVQCGSWKLVGTWEFNSPIATSLFSPDGNSLVVRGTLARTKEERGRPLHFIDTSSLKERPLDLPEDVVVVAARFTRDNKALVMTTRERQSYSIRVFNPQSGKLVLQVPLDESPLGLTVSADARYVGSVFKTSGVRIFDLSSGQEVTRIGLGATESVSALHFSEDTRTVALVSVWDTPDDSEGLPEVGVRRQLLRNDELIREACDRVTRPLSQDEWKKFLPGYSYRESCAQLPASAKR